MKRILTIHGPNLNLLGQRDPSLYGSFTLDELNQKIVDFAAKNGVEVKLVQSNYEGEIVDEFHKARGYFDGIIINPAAYAHYSYVIRSAIESIQVPCLEVHISNVHKGDAFRKKDIIGPVCVGVISGLGWMGYLLALEYFLFSLRQR